jgi:subtilisin family serine protease
MWGQSVSIWGEPGNSFNVSLKILNSSNVTLASSTIYSTNDTNTYSEGQIIIGTDTIFYNLSSDSANLLNNRPHMRIRIRNLNTGVYKIALFANGTPGTVNCWNVIELTNDIGNWGSAFTAAMTGWDNGDFYCGVGEPACTESIISVASHLSEIKLASGTIAGGTISYYSSYGPTYDGRLKPDISAPGQNVCSSVSSFTNQSLSSMVTSVDFNGRNYKFYRLSGTSMSSPMVTGIVALMLQANPTLTASQTKDIIRLTAREDINTGNIPDTGSYRWGWGKINAWRAVKMAYTGKKEYNTDGNFIIYPNPASDNIYIINEEDKTPLIVSIFNVLGEKIIDKRTIINNQLNIHDFTSGVYIIEITKGQSRSIQKLIKQ